MMNMEMNYNEILGSCFNPDNGSYKDINFILDKICHEIAEEGVYKDLFTSFGFVDKSIVGKRLREELEKMISDKINNHIYRKISSDDYYGIHSTLKMAVINRLIVKRAEKQGIILTKNLTYDEKMDTGYLNNDFEEKWNNFIQGLITQLKSTGFEDLKKNLTVSIPDISPSTEQAIDSHINEYINSTDFQDFLSTRDEINYLREVLEDDKESEEEKEYEIIETPKRIEIKRQLSGKKKEIFDLTKSLVMIKCKQFMEKSYSNILENSDYLSVILLQTKKILEEKLMESDYTVTATDLYYTGESVFTEKFKPEEIFPLFGFDYDAYEKEIEDIRTYKRNEPSFEEFSRRKLTGQHGMMVNGEARYFTDREVMKVLNFMKNQNYVLNDIVFTKIMKLYIEKKVSLDDLESMFGIISENEMPEAYDFLDEEENSKTNGDTNGDEGRHL